MSPEQASAGKVDRRSDVFALGIVLFELTTGERLFRGDDPAHTLALVKHGRIPAPKEIYAKYPDGLSRVVSRALSRDVSERFQTAAEFRDALEQYLKSERVLVSPAGVGQLVRRVLGARVEQQRKALREALTQADGQLAAGLVPDQPVAADPSTPRAFGSASEPPASLSSASQLSHSRTGTPRPQTLAASAGRSAGLWPLLAAIGGLLSAFSAIFWVSHRAAPAPLITSQLNSRAPQASPDRARRDDSPGPVGVNIDSLPTAEGLAQALPDADVMSSAATGRSAGLSSRSAPAPRGDKARSLGPPATPGTGKGPPPDPVAAGSAPEPSAAPAVPTADHLPLNRGAALSALGSAAAAAGSCKRPEGPAGPGSASVTFSPNGAVKSLAVSPPFAGTAVGQCVLNAFRGAHVPAFTGSSITLQKSFQIPH
jgi:hypothetical protein